MRKGQKRFREPTPGELTISNCANSSRFRVTEHPNKIIADEVTYEEATRIVSGGLVPLSPEEMREAAATLADEAAAQDERDNGIAQTGAAIGLGDAIRAIPLSRAAAGRGRTQSDDPTKEPT